jgi:hypothetical protein
MQNCDLNESEKCKYEFWNHFVPCNGEFIVGTTRDAESATSPPSLLKTGSLDNQTMGWWVLTPEPGSKQIDRERKLCKALLPAGRFEKHPPTFIFVENGRRIEYFVLIGGPRSYRFRRLGKSDNATHQQIRNLYIVTTSRANIANLRKHRLFDRGISFRFLSILGEVT